MKSCSQVGDKLWDQQMQTKVHLGSAMIGGSLVMYTLTNKVPQAIMEQPSDACISWHDIWMKPSLCLYSLPQGPGQLESSIGLTESLPQSQRCQSFHCPVLTAHMP